MVIMDEQYNGIQLEIGGNNNPPCVLKNGVVQPNSAFHNQTTHIKHGITNIGQSISTGINAIPNEIYLLRDRVVNKNYFLLSDGSEITDEDLEKLQAPTIKSISSTQAIKRPIGIKDNDTGLDQTYLDAQSSHRFRSYSSPSVPLVKTEALHTALENWMLRSMTLRGTKSKSTLNNSNDSSADEMDEDEELRIRSFSVGANLESSESPQSKKKMQMTLEELKECQEIIEIVKNQQQSNIILVSRDGCENTLLLDDEKADRLSPKNFGNNSQLAIRSTTSLSSSTTTPNSPSPNITSPRSSPIPNTFNRSNSTIPTSNKPVPPPRSIFSLQHSTGSLTVPSSLTPLTPNSTPTRSTTPTPTTYYSPKQSSRSQLSTSSPKIINKHLSRCDSNNNVSNNNNNSNNNSNNKKSNTLSKSKSSSNVPLQTTLSSTNNTSSSSIASVSGGRSSPSLLSSSSSSSFQNELRLHLKIKEEQRKERLERLGITCE